MKLTKEQITENLACYKQMQETGSAEGIQWLSSMGNEWIQATSNPPYMEARRIYRRKPQLKWRAWKNEEVKVGITVRGKVNPKVVFQITGKLGTCVILGKDNYTYAGLFTDYEQLDGTPCGVQTTEDKQ
jgi:hypothetical protein